MARELSEHVLSPVTPCYVWIRDRTHENMRHSSYAHVVACCVVA